MAVNKVNEVVEVGPCQEVAQADRRSESVVFDRHRVVTKQAQGGRGDGGRVRIREIKQLAGRVRGRE